MNYLVVAVLLVITILGYFRLAKFFDIVDRPNHRSSHSEVTIRGAGIIFPVSIVFCWFQFTDVNPLLITGLLLICIISFIDDLITVSAVIRLFIHLLAVSLALYALNIYSLWPWWLIAIAYIFIIGSINAFNFMDGINGITGIYSLIALLSMFYVNKYVSHFAADALLICPAIACVVFLYFNFRKRARCFAGDVGSIGIAFWLIILSILIIEKTNNCKYLFLFSIYGTDVFLTIIKRIKLKQNLLQAHRLHVYQLLVNNGGYSHRSVALMYGGMQLLINGFILLTNLNFAFYLLVTLMVLGSIYMLIERRYRFPAMAV